MSADLIRVRVSKVIPEADGVVSLILRDAAGNDLPSWEPGAHIDVYVPGGVVRQYSLCGDPLDRGSWRIAVLLEAESRGGSTYLHTSVLEGSELQVGLPRNHFPLVTADRYLFVAGGIGITPILAMARSIGQTRPWRLIYGGRSRSSMAFCGDVETFGGEVLIRPQDECGLLDLTTFLGDVDADCVVYCCGPQPLIEAVELALKGCAPGTLRVERFHAEQVVLDDVSDQGFIVELAQRGIEVRVTSDETIVDALLGAGVRVKTSCAEGVCGTCETAVLAGQPDHRDSVLSDEEREANETMMLCCSRSKGDRLVLDL